MWYLIGALVAVWIGWEAHAIREHGWPRLTGITEGWARDTRAAIASVRARLARGR